MVLQSLEQHFKALFMRDLWTKAGKSVQRNALNELIPTCCTQFRNEKRHVQLPDKSRQHLRFADDAILPATLFTTFIHLFH